MWKKKIKIKSNKTLCLMKSRRPKFWNLLPNKAEWMREFKAFVEPHAHLLK